MKINQQFNTFTKKEYFYYIDHHKRYTNFNTLGLYRSILENKKLNIEDKIEIREYAHKQFLKAFNFLQLKDPLTFFEVSHLGEELTKGDEKWIWEKIKNNQKKILVDKRIKHRSFGVYSKHNCGYKDCVYQGVMIKPGSPLQEDIIHFDGDKNKYFKKEKSERNKIDRKKGKQIINDEVNNI